MRIIDDPDFHFRRARQQLYSQIESSCSSSRAYFWLMTMLILDEMESD